MVTSFLYRICEWVFRFAYVHVLWLFFTAMGLFLFGIFPSTIAMFTIVRKWILGDADIPILPTFWKNFKQTFLKANLLGLILTGTALLIMIEYMIIQHVDDPIIQFSKYPLLLFVINFLLTLCYVFPTYVHYELTLLQVIKNAFFIMLVNPLNNVIIILGLVFLFYIIQIVPAILYFFGGSLAAYILMWGSLRSFSNVEEKKRKLEVAK